MANEIANAVGGSLCTLIFIVPPEVCAAPSSMTALGWLMIVSGTFAALAVGLTLKRASIRRAP